MNNVSSIVLIFCGRLSLYASGMVTFFKSSLFNSLEIESPTSERKKKSFLITGTFVFTFSNSSPAFRQFVRIAT